MENENDKIEMLKKFGEVNKRYITNEDFYKKNENENMQFLNIFIGLGAFNNDNFNEIPYIKKTKQTLLLLKTELQDFNIKFEKIENLNYLDKGGKLDDRLNLIFYDEKEKIPSYKNELIQKIQTFIDFFFNKLEKVLNHLSLCFSKDENKKKYIMK